MPKRLTTQEFIAKAREVHGSRYDYSRVEYRNNRSKILVGCKVHGWFEQSPLNHTSQKQGCPQCGRIDRAKSNTLTTQEFIARAKEIHGAKYDYSKVEYKKMIGKVEIICRRHNSFRQIANDHVNGIGCPKCGIEFRANIHQYDTQEFIARAKEIHGAKYDYSKVEYISSNKKVELICRRHNSFRQTPNLHLQGGGCPICKSSKGEKRIEKFLKKYKLNYTRQKRFNACQNKTHLPFDFYFQIQDHHFLVEYDGPQHFRTVNHWGGEKAFERTKQNDQTKNQFAKDHGFILIRIPYTDYDRIEFILREAIETHTGQPLEITPSQPQTKRKVAPLKGRQLDLL